MRNRLVLQLCLFFLCLPTLLHAQKNTGNNTLVKGIIADASTNETIPYATIRVFQETKPEKVYKALATDENGNFKINIEQGGNYILVVEYIGKNKTEKKFTADNSKALDLGTILLADDNKLLSEVVVTAQKPLVKVDLDKITYSIEDDPEATTSTALDMLKKVPMITVDGEDNIQLKGSSGYKIYVNGKPSTMITSNPKDVLKSMPASSIKNIEVITDPGAKYDAEGLAGIINIITQKQSSMGGYNATVNSRVDTRGGYGMGAFLTAKVGKFGFSGNYNYYSYRQPWNTSKSFTENKEDSKYKYLNQTGRNKNKGNGQYGSGEISYEIDTLNLVTVGFNRYHGTSKNDQDMSVLYQSTSFENTMQYDQYTKGKSTYGSTDLSADYQRSSAKVKDRLYTASYRLSLSPNDWSSDNRRTGILKTSDLLNNQYSDGSSNEHTFQLDFTTPFAKIHTLEAGAKYIIRLNKSNSGYQFKDQEADDWTIQSSDLDHFKHQQDIIAAYLGYNVKLNKFGFKVGGRYEYTDVKVKYSLAPTNNFGSNYSNLIPSATVSYQLKPTQNFRLGYNMRILRPGIYQLNPFSNTTDSTNISVGNPKLDAVKSHSISLNYSFFNPKLNINANLSYDFANNNIEDITTSQNGIRKTTYENIGKNKNLALNTYISWAPTSKLKIINNTSATYIDIKANNQDNLSNSGFSIQSYMNIAYTLPAKFRLNGFVAARTKQITLQSEGYAGYFYGMSVSKDLLKDKLSLTLSAQNFMTKNLVFKNETKTPTMHMRTEDKYKFMRVGISVSYKFGEMKEQIKKAKRTITNDDVMSGGQQGQQGGGQGG